MMEKHERLQQQIAFLMEIDKVKNIFRQTYLADGERKENDAEHSWAHCADGSTFAGACRGRGGSFESYDDGTDP